MFVFVLGPYYRRQRLRHAQKVMCRRSKLEGPYESPWPVRHSKTCWFLCIRLLTHLPCHRLDCKGRQSSVGCDTSWTLIKRVDVGLVRRGNEHSTVIILKDRREKSCTLYVHCPCNTLNSNAGLFILYWKWFTRMCIKYANLILKSKYNFFRTISRLRTWFQIRTISTLIYLSDIDFSENDVIRVVT